MSNSGAEQAEGFIRYKKIKGTHRMFCPVRKRKVVLGKGRDDGNIAYLTPAGVPAGNSESWEQMDSNSYVAEVAEKELQENAGEPDGTLVIKEVEGGFDVVNTATEKPVNTSPLSKEDAEAFISGSPEEKKGFFTRMKDAVTGGKDKEKEPPKDGEGDDLVVCPENHEFGKDHDEHEACDNCALADGCQAAKVVED